ncbi:MAG: CinA family protein, partial [Methanomassiliicoccaceae archaeon]|nr:CinA family protein [Methanomassiliicoccaceae archaeon]
MISDAVGELAELLLKKRYTISIAESCTGGMISSSITNIPGASE